MKALKSAILASLLLTPFMALAQNPPPVAAFTYSGSSWIAAATTSAANPINYQPPAAALYCFNSGTGKWVPADSSCFGGGGGGGNLSGTLTPTQLLFGSAAHTVSGIPGSTVDGTNGLISLVPTGSGVALTLQQDASGSDALIVNANEGAGLVGGTLVDFSAQENDAAAGQVIALDLGATENNSTGNPTSVIDLDITAADSSNIGADLVSNIFATITPQAVSGVGAEFSNIILMHTADPLPDIAPLISTGIHIQDINAGSNPATTVNAGILIDDQTAGANVYAIKTGAGAVTLGGSAITLPNLPATTKADVVGIDPSTGALTKQAAGGYPATESHTASNSASLSFTTCGSSFTSSNDYEIRWSNLIPATNNVDLYLRMDSDSTSGHYINAVFRWIAAAAGEAAGVTTAIMLDDAQTQLSNTSPAGISGRMILHNLPSTTVNKSAEGQATALNTNSGTYPLGSSMSGVYLQNAAVTNLQISFSSGNITSGTVTCQPLPN